MCYFKLSTEYHSDGASNTVALVLLHPLIAYSTRSVPSHNTVYLLIFIGDDFYITLVS